MTNTPLPKPLEAFIEAYNAMDVPAMMACLHQEAVFENISNYHASMHWQGIEAIQNLAEASAAAFASRKQTVKSAVISADGLSVALQVEFAGVPLVDLPNGMKAGEAAILRGASFFKLEDDKIISLSDFS